MGEIIGRMACPVCGAPGQNLKVNKNGNLYVYCDKRCSTRFNAQESREITDILRQGETVRRGGLVITPAVMPVAVKTNKREVKDDGKSRESRDTADGRSDAGSAAGTDGRAGQRPVERFAAWLWGDDDD